MVAVLAVGRHKEWFIIITVGTAILLVKQRALDWENLIQFGISVRVFYVSCSNPA